MSFVITSGCIDSKERFCLDQCPVECIYEGERMLYIDPGECIDCGACAPVCPQGAIFRAADLPALEAPFQAINGQFIDAIGEANLSHDTVYSDHPTVAASPRRTDG